MRSQTVQVDPTNVDQQAAWEGDEGAYWVAHADRFDRSIAEHNRPFLAAAAIGASDRVLDVGCGTGQTTRDAARMATAGTALGIDLSDRMLSEARSRSAAEGITNASYLQADAQIHSFDPGQFDVAIARTSAMFFGNHAAAFVNIRGALRSGGRLVLATWQGIEGNEWLREIGTALAAGREPRIPPPGVGPLSLSQPDRVRALLTEARFADIDLQGVEAPMWFGSTGADAAGFILGLTGWMLDGLDDAGRTRARQLLDASTAAHEGEHGVTFASAMWIITARAA